MDYKSFQLSELKAAEDTPGRFSGFAAIYDTQDRNREIIDRGAMTRTIAKNGGEFPLFFNHSYDETIGIVRLEDTERGAKALGQIDTEDPFGRKIYSKLLPPKGFNRGQVRDLSIGYVVKDDYLKKGIRHLREIAIFEASIVTVSAHPDTFITQVKGQQAQAARISQLELAIKSLQATLIEEGLISDPEKLHALISAALDRPGEKSVGQGDEAHPEDCAAILEEMRFYNYAKEIAHERSVRH